MKFGKSTIPRIEHERDFQRHLSIRKRSLRSNHVRPRVLEFNDLKPVALPPIAQEVVFGDKKVSIDMKTKMMIDSI